MSIKYMTELPGLAEACQKVQKPESRTVQTLEQLKSLAARLNEVEIYAVDTETTSLSIPRLALVGISFAFSETEAWYVPTGHISLEKQLDIHTVVEAIRPALEDPKKQALLHHAKYDIAVLRKYNINLPMAISMDFQNINDSMIAAWILDENQPKSLKKLAQKNFGMQMTQFKKLGSTTVTTEEGGSFYENEVLGVIAEEDDFTDISAISVQTAAAYAKDDAIATFKLNRLFKEQLIEENLYKQYLTELRLTPVMVHMSFNGVCLDSAKVKEKHEAAVKDVVRLEETIKGLMLQNPKTVARVEARRLKLPKKAQDGATLASLLTLKSPQLKNQILYEDLGLSDEKTIVTKSGNYSTAKWALKALVRKGQRPGASENEKLGGEIAESLLKFSQKTKLIDAFFKPLTEKAVDGKIYTQFNNVGTATGRFSAQNPNLMQMPRDTKEEQFREIFVAPKGYKWVSVDLSQIELRLGAHYSSDPAMLNAYANDEDIHTRTAIQMSGKNPEDFEGGSESKEWKMIRTLGKILNFGVFYGMSGDKLYDTLVNEFGMPEDSITPEECNKKIEAFFVGYAGVKDFIHRQHLLVEQNKYVTTLLGRKRRLPHATRAPRLTQEAKRDPVKYEAWRRLNSLYYSALRISVNTVIQGTAADLIKIMMVKTFNEVIQSGKYDVGNRHVHLLLQVHDELNLYAPEETADAVMSHVKQIMVDVGVACKLRVPVKGSGSTGASWSDAK